MTGEIAHRWAGPWLVDERWWDPESEGVGSGGRTARAQALLDDGEPGAGLLLCYRRRRWYLEGRYE